MNPPPCFDISEELQNHATCRPKHITPVDELLDYVTRNWPITCTITWFRITVKSLWTVLPASLGCLILEMEKSSILGGQVESAWRIDSFESQAWTVFSRTLWKAAFVAVRAHCSCVELRSATQRLHCPSAIKQPSAYTHVCAYRHTCAHTHNSGLDLKAVKKTAGVKGCTERHFEVKLTGHMGACTCVSVSFHRGWSIWLIIMRLCLTLCDGCESYDCLSLKNSEWHFIMLLCLLWVFQLLVFVNKWINKYILKIYTHCSSPHVSFSMINWMWWAKKTVFCKIIQRKCLWMQKKSYFTTSDI